MDNNYDTPEYFEQIEQYLDGAMPPEDAARFETLLRADAALAAVVEAQRATRAGLRAYGLKKDIAGMHARMMEAVPQQTAVVRKLSPLRIIGRVAAAAVVLLALVSVYEYSTVSADKLYAQKEAVYEARVNRGDAGPVLTAYLSGDKETLLQPHWGGPAAVRPGPATRP